VKIIACIKAVPDAGSRLVISDSKTWVRDEDLTFVMNEADEYALEAALSLGETDGEVVVVSLGDEGVGRSLRTGLAKGAHRAIHLKDEMFEGGDEYATARVLSRAIAKDGGADLVLTGVQSDDLGSGVTGIMMAEMLGWNHASVVIGIEGDPESGTLRVRRELEGGRQELLDVDLPAVLTIQYGINEPRYASLRGIMAAKKKEIRIWSAEDLGFSRDEVGREGSLCEVSDLTIPSAPNEVHMISGTPAEAARTLVELLRREARVI